MDTKVFWFDGETTGTDAKVNGLIQLAGLMEINGEVVDEINLKIKPFKGQLVSAEACEVHGIAIADLRTDEYLNPDKAYVELTRWFCKHIDKWSKLDKAYVGGQNVGFDVDFLNAFYKNNHDKYLGSFINWRRLDSLILAHVAAYLGFLVVPDFKLATLCEYFKIPLVAHDALSDVKAARRLFYELLVLNSGTPEHFTKGYRQKTVKTPKETPPERASTTPKAVKDKKKTQAPAPKKGSLDEILASPQTSDEPLVCPVCEKRWDGKSCSICGHES